MKATTFLCSLSSFLLPVSFPDTDENTALAQKRESTERERDSVPSLSATTCRSLDLRPSRDCVCKLNSRFDLGDRSGGKNCPSSGPEEKRGRPVAQSCAHAARFRFSRNCPFSLWGNLERLLRLLVCSESCASFASFAPLATGSVQFVAKMENFSSFHSTLFHLLQDSDCCSHLASSLPNPIHSIPFHSTQLDSTRLDLSELHLPNSSLSLS